MGLGLGVRVRVRVRVDGLWDKADADSGRPAERPAGEQVLVCGVSGDGGGSLSAAGRGTGAGWMG